MNEELNIPQQLADLDKKLTEVLAFNDQLFDKLEEILEKLHEMREFQY